MTSVLTPPTPSAPTELLTWEAYMAEPQTEGRYDIVEGRRVCFPTPTWRHQRILGNVASAFGDYEKQTKVGVVVFAPFDVLVRRAPKLQIRQPDVLFMSHERVKSAGGVPEVGPLPFAPELVVEIVSTTETERILGDKIVDYTAIGVSEVWVVRPDVRTVEVLTLTANGPQSVAMYSETEAAQSVTFPALSVPLVDVFAE